MGNTEVKFRGSLYTAIKAMGRDRRANVAITFAVALIPIVGFVGAAID
jgi:Flp pilus assembly protein TadG